MPTASRHILAILVSATFSTAFAAEPSPPADKTRPAAAAAQAAESVAGAVAAPFNFLRISYNLGENTATAPSAVDGDLWARIRDGLSLDELDSPLVQEHVRWYAKRPEYVKRVVDRSRRYLFHIVEEVEKRAMPMEVALLPMVESAFNPMAYSRSHASGIWQFIPSTGRLFGLKQNAWYDGRRDILAATDAALEYLQNLHNMFGSWELALAAYNCGEGCVQRAVNRNAAKGLPTDYRSLNLPTETRHYVPKLMAVRTIVTNPQAYGLAISTIPNEPYFAKVNLKNSIDVKLAARLADVPVEEFLSLNPAYSRKVVRSDTPRPVLLPVEKVDLFAANLENVDQPLVSWDSYQARKGEKLSAIAARYRVTVSWLREHNKLKLRRDRLASDQVLTVPASSFTEASWKRFEEQARTADKSRKAESHAASEATHEVSHVVRKGETVSGIARRYGVTAQDIRNWNDLESDRIAPRRKLVILSSDPGAKAATPARANKAGKPAAKPSKRIYTVRRGDTLFSIAQHLNVDLEDLKRANRIGSRSRLTIGKKLVIPASANG